MSFLPLATIHANARRLARWESKLAKTHAAHVEREAWAACPCRCDRCSAHRVGVARIVRWALAPSRLWRRASRS